MKIDLVKITAITTEVTQKNCYIWSAAHSCMDGFSVFLTTCKLSWSAFFVRTSLNSVLLNISTGSSQNLISSKCQQETCVPEQPPLLKCDLLYKYMQVVTTHILTENQDEREAPAIHPNFENLNTFLYFSITDIQAIFTFLAIIPHYSPLKFLFLIHTWNTVFLIVYLTLILIVSTLCKDI